MKKLKSILCVVISAVILLSCVVTALANYSSENRTSEFYFPVGDVNMDYILNAADARRIIRVAARMDTFVEQPDWVGSTDRRLGDADFDGKITAADARYVLRISAGLLTVPELYQMVNERNAKNASRIAAATTTPTLVYETTTAAATKETTNLATYYIKAKITNGDQSVTIESAVNGTDYYLYSEDISKEYAVMRLGTENYILDKSYKEYYKSTSAIGEASALVTALKDAYQLEITDFSDLTGLNTSKTDDFTIIDFGSYKYYIDSLGELEKIELLEGTSVATTIEVVTFTTDSTEIANIISVPADYTSLSFVEFIENFVF